jgi:hypothetical protein
LSYGHVLHSLLLTRFVVGAQYWCRQREDFRLLQARLSYDLARVAATVTLDTKGTAQTHPVIPDAWLLFERVKNGNHVPILLEIDRGMEYQQRFKQHIRSRIKFIEEGVYTQVFQNRSVTIAYLTSGQVPEYHQSRRETMRKWTMEVLAEQGKENWAGVFRFGSMVLDNHVDLTLFEQPVWYRPDSAEPLPLLTR